MLNIENLRIEKLTAQDFSLHYKLVSNAEVMKMITGKPMNKEEAEEKFRMILKCNDLHADLGYFKIMDNKTGEFIGVAKIEIKEIDSIEAEIGYLIIPDFWGKGIASKVAKWLLEIAKQEHQLNKLFAIIDPENIPSRKILENNGFHSIELKNFDGLPGELFYRILRI